jgi:hypothetical protein
VKLAMAGAAAALAWSLRRRVFRPALETPPGWARGLAALSALLWLATLTAGKFLEYTHKMLLVG